MTRPKHFTISDDMELLWESGIYSDIDRRVERLAPLTDSKGKPLHAKTRRKIVRATVDGISITRSIHRDADSWVVRWQSQIESEHFTASFEEWRGLGDDSSDYGLSLAGCVGHFLNFVGGVDRKNAHAIIAQCEKDGSIDAQDAMMARLALK